MTCISVTATVDVEVDLSEIDTDDLERELENRAVEIGRADAGDVPKIFDALYVGNEALAMELVRKFVQDATGRTLP